MGKLSQRRRPGQIFRNVSALVSDDKSLPEVMAQGYALPQMIEDLRKYQAELEIQNKALRFSQRAAEGASERFLTLFSSVPLALMVNSGSSVQHAFWGTFSEWIHLGSGLRPSF